MIRLFHDAEQSFITILTLISRFVFLCIIQCLYLMKLIKYKAINSIINPLVPSPFAHFFFIFVCFSSTLQFISVCSPLCFCYAFVMLSLCLRYASVMLSLCHRFFNGGRSSSQRRQIEFTTKDERMTIEAQTRDVKSLSSTPRRVGCSKSL